jgi:hypothetical protein
MKRYNITYLLGAGASCKCLPTYSDFHSRLEQFFKFLSSTIPSDSTTIDFKKRYNSLISEIPQYITPDAYVKALHLTNNEEEISLKKLISVYLIFEQLQKDQRMLDSIGRQISDKYKNLKEFDRPNYIKRLLEFNNPIDPRYLPFFANLIFKKENEISIAPINIVSWNYDSQVETALKRFQFNHLMDSNKDLFQFIKLNGSANFPWKSQALTFDFNEHHMTSHTVKDMIEFLKTQNEECETMELKFAWEVDDESVKRNRENAKKVLSETDIVVVIGYSFPDFNRYIDRELFAGFKGGKIYIQDPNGAIIKERFEGVKADFRNVHVRSDRENFLVPSEFWESKKGDWLKTIGN